MITVDASVWTAVFEEKDRFHQESVQFLREYARRRCKIYSPWLAMVETGCALARRHRDASRALSAVRDLQAIPTLHLMEHDSALLNEALECGTRFLLRGADAFYAATASITRTKLITWDAELIERADGISPADWLS